MQRCRGLEFLKPRGLEVKHTRSRGAVTEGVQSRCRCRGAEVQSEVQRSRGAEVQRCSSAGAAVQRCSGADASTEVQR